MSLFAAVIHSHRHAIGSRGGIRVFHHDDDELKPMFIEACHSVANEAGTDPADVEADQSTRDLVEFARHVHKVRLRANEVLGSRILCDPKFEMLLGLFVAAHDRRSVSVGDMCTYASVPATTGLRHIEVLETLGFLTRVPDIDDGRRSWVKPSAKCLTDIALLMSLFRIAQPRPD